MVRFLSILVLLFVFVLSSQQVGATSAESSTQGAVFAQDMKKFERKRVREITKKYEIRATYPSFGIASIDEPIAAMVQGQIADFKNFVADLDMAELPYGFDLNYKSYVTKNIRTIALESYQYTGGAHGSGQVVTLYFDRTTLKPTSLAASYFLPGYLEVLSTLSKQKLMSYFGEDAGMDMEWIQDGTLPTKENFSTVIPTKDGVIVHFGQYQVAPYAAGMQDIFIPRSEIQESLMNE